MSELNDYEREILRGAAEDAKVRLARWTGMMEDAAAEYDRCAQVVENLKEQYEKLEKHLDSDS